MASARPDIAASHLLRKSRIWLPAALPCSLGSPCAAYASMNSYASSMALQREASSVGDEGGCLSGAVCAGASGVPRNTQMPPTGRKLASVERFEPDD